MRFEGQGVCSTGEHTGGVVVEHTVHSVRHDPSAQRVAPTGQVTCVGHSEKADTHSPPGQRTEALAGHSGTDTHCWLLSTHMPSGHRTGRLAGQLLREGQSSSDPRQLPSGQRMGVVSGQEVGVTQ